MQLPLVTLVALAVVVVALAAVRSRFLRARLAFAAVLLVASAGLEGALGGGWGDPALLGGLARLAIVAAGIVAVVALAVNPWAKDRPSERVPAIVQDVVVIGLFAVAATLLLDEKLLTTSAVGAVVVGFALQDTLGNLFAGLAIQVEKPFRVGHWIRVGDYEGQVQEVTWRATKLLTKAGQFVIVPNSVVSKDPILNHSEPTVPTRLEVDVGLTYDAAPNLAKRALLEAVENAPLALRDPAPDVIVIDFGASSVNYRVRFWIADFGLDDYAYDQVRSHLWYTLRRHGIEIPYPIQIEYSREEQVGRQSSRIRYLADRLAEIDLFAGLDDVECARLAEACPERLYGAGERIVRQGDAGQSMFVVLDGRVRVTLEPSGQEVAITSRGGFFGEMSMLTGEARTATVSALDDALLMEISAERFRELAVLRQGLVEHVSDVVMARRAGLASAKAAADEAQTGAPTRTGLLQRIRKYLAL
ncbi:MAG: cyclic nucleotide-binding domain-containing protein [Vicinamibacterales bacterium]